MATGIILTIELPDETATQALARSLAALANSGEQLALIGDLGTGKTVFARAFIRALCGADIEVPSPTFTIVQTYDAKDGRELFHFDLYRLESPDEALELDIDDAFANGISLIEWPERLGSFLPPNHLKLTLSYSDTESQRLAIITAGNNWTERLREISL
jgi:tRNA threonylcarbamoyladenosine biosynthesis protein TsaE